MLYGIGNLRDREVACLALDLQGSNFESCVWRTVSSQSSLTILRRFSRPSLACICAKRWPKVRYIQTVIMMGFFVFFQDLCEFVIHCNKRHIFLCLFVLLAHYYWWKWSHYCRIKKVIFFEWHFYHLIRGFPSLDFSQLWKMMPALAFNSIIVATSAWRGKWNRHAVVPSNNFFYAGAILKFL